MSDTTDTRVDTTRQQILRAAAHQFAQRPYHQVGLDDVLAEAELTKGAMYFHFRSKHALALAIIDDHTNEAAARVADVLTRKLSGLETLIDFFYLIAVRDITEDTTRAALHLLDTVGRIEGLRARLLEHWVKALTGIVERAITEGDVVEQRDPQDVGHLLVSLYMGMRQTSDLDDPEKFLLDLERAWAPVLPGIVRADSIDYFSQFIRRRTLGSIGTVSAQPQSD